MSDRRPFRLATTGARLVAGTLVAAAFATAVATAVALPWPTVQREPLTVAANPAPADTVVACAGPLLALGRDPERADALSVAAQQEVVYGAPPDGATPAVSVLTSPDVPESEGPAVFTAQPQDRTPSQLAASGSATVDEPDLAGFAASACQAPLMQSWIVGGATTTGAADLLLLGNPGDVPATVQLTVYGAAGAQVPPGGSDQIVPAGEQRIVPLAGLLLGEESPVVRVTATGAPVQAALQTSITRTLVPGGVDQAAPIAAAATTQVISGVVVTAPPGAEGASEATSVVRLLSADSDAAATVSVTDEDGAIVSTQELPLISGVPAGLRVDGLPVGTYSVRVDASAPVVSAVWQASGSGVGDDFAWYAAAPALTADALVAVPEGPDPTLWAYNAGNAAATVAVESLFGGEATETSIPPGQVAEWPLTATEVYRVRASGEGVHASVSFSGEGALAGMPVWSQGSAAGTVVVYP